MMGEVLSLLLLSNDDDEEGVVLLVEVTVKGEE